MVIREIHFRNNIKHVRERIDKKQKITFSLKSLIQNGGK